MRAIDIGVGHDDYPVIAQRRLVVTVAGAAAQCQQQIGKFLIAAQLVGRGRGDVQNLATQRQHRLGVAPARLLGGAARRIALDQEDFGIFPVGARAVGQFAGQAQPLGCGLALGVLLLPALQPFFGLVDDEAQQLVRLFRLVGQPMVEPVLHRLFDKTGGMLGDQLFLGLALELRVTDEDRQHDGRAAQNIVRRDLRGALVADQVAIGFQGAQQRRAQTLFMGTAQRGRYGIAVGVQEAVILVRRPGNRPFDAAIFAILHLHLAGEGLCGDLCAILQRMAEEICESARKMQRVTGRRRVAAGDQYGIAAPADFHTLEQIGLGARQAIQHGRLETCPLAENVRVGMEFQRGAAPVRGGADHLQRALRCAAAEMLGVKPLVAGDLDGQPVGQRIHHGDADAVQAAGGLIDGIAELAAGMQGGEDHLQRRLVAIFRVRVDRNAAAIVAHDDTAIFQQVQFDAVGMAGDRLVHRIVEHFGNQMVQGALVGAADIHAGPAPDRLQPFENLDILGGVIAGIARCRLKKVCHKRSISAAGNGSSVSCGG